MIGLLRNSYINIVLGYLYREMFCYVKLLLVKKKDSDVFIIYLFRREESKYFKYENIKDIILKFLFKIS